MRIDRQIHFTVDAATLFASTLGPGAEDPLISLHFDAPLRIMRYPFALKGVSFH